MAPHAMQDQPAGVPHVSTPKRENATQDMRKPVQATGVLDSLAYEDLTPAIGRAFENVNIIDDIMNAENANDRLRELALIISQRGVVFFRAQDNMTIDQQKDFVQRLGLLSGKPSDSHLHHHPILNKTAAEGTVDPHLSQISSVDVKLQFDWQKMAKKPKRMDAARWHTDVHYETKPPDYSCLRMTKLPPNGGDTLWASGYDLFDHYSEPYQKLFEGLTTTNVSDGYVAAAKADPERVQLFEGPRGAPDNVGGHLSAVYPVVRTNPVTGWKSIFSVGPFPKRINELSLAESDKLLKEFNETIAMHPQMQVRHKWRNANDMAIWDNRSAFHIGLLDYEGLGERFGYRVVSIGEKPYLDSNSTSRKVALGLDNANWRLD